MALCGVCKNKNFILTQKNFRQINYLVNSTIYVCIVEPLLSRKCKLQKFSQNFVKAMVLLQTEFTKYVVDLTIFSLRERISCFSILCVIYVVFVKITFFSLKHTMHVSWFHEIFFKLEYFFPHGLVVFITRKKYFVQKLAESILS